MQIDGVTYLPPASRGDIERCAQEFDALLMIDGVFHHDVAPSPKEVLAACRQVAMFGSCSMGALRAAECWPYGMHPLGIIARWYIAEYIDGDDEVAVLVHPQTQTALTVPVVNVRFVAWQARRRGILTAAQADAFVRRSRDVFYMDRTWDDVVACAPGERREAVRAIIANGADLKKLDARFSLRSVFRSRGLLGSLATTS